jgi:hypothetical protein
MMDLDGYISLFPGATREKPRFMSLADAEFRAFIQDKLALWRTDGTNGNA